MPDERKLSRLVVVGASHRTSSEATRDRLLIKDDNLAGLLAQLRQAGLPDAVVLSTCARTEIFGLASDVEAARTSLVECIAKLGRFDIKEIAPQTYFYQAENALRHLFRVASSLDSPIVGEPEVTGQFREAVRMAGDANFLGPELKGIVQAINRTVKRVRSETTIGERPVSMAACAVQVAKDVHGDLSRTRSILISGGEMGELIVDQMLDAGLKQLTILARRPARAEATARRYGCHHSRLDSLPGMLAETDIVISSLGDGSPLFRRDNVSEALAARRRRPVLFIDAAIPSDVDLAVNDLDGAFVYSLDDLERIAVDGRYQRCEAASDAEAIIDVELKSYQRVAAERNAVPSVSMLREHFERIRQEVLLGTGAKDPEFDQLTRLLINKLLHQPSEVLRELSVENPERASETASQLRKLFGLPDDDDQTRE